MILRQLMPSVKHVPSGRSHAHLVVCPDGQVVSPQLAETTLAKWVEQLRARYSTLRQIADLIRMSESGFTRGVKRGTLSIENLLDLARAVDEDPSKVLRMAGKDRVVELIERHYGRSDETISAAEREHLARWRRLKVPTRTRMEGLISDVLHEGWEIAQPSQRRKKA